MTSANTGDRHKRASMGTGTGTGAGTGAPLLSPQTVNQAGGNGRIPSNDRVHQANHQAHIHAHHTHHHRSQHAPHHASNHAPPRIHAHIRAQSTPAATITSPIPPSESTPKALHPANQLHNPRPRRARKLSSTEVLYPSPEVAKEAFEAERSRNPYHRRAPTPHVSKPGRARSRSSDRSESGMERKASDRSLRSKVSFDSTRSGRSARSGVSGASGATVSDRTAREGATVPSTGGLGAWDPGFGASRGIGPEGEAIEVIGLGRKTPRHRTFSREMLKPALRGSRRDLRGAAGFGREVGSGGDKPLMHRPMSVVGSVMDIFRGNPRSKARDYGVADPGVASCRPQEHHSRSHSTLPSSLPSASGLRNPQVLRSLFSSLSLEPSRSSSSFTSSSTHNLAPYQGHQHQHHPPPLLHPSDRLLTYLSLAHIPSWRDWPNIITSNGSSQSRNAPKWWGSIAAATMRSKGVGDMGWEWHRRLQLAEAGRMGRGLRGWEGADRYWERRVRQWCEENVPDEPIAEDVRWGKQIFALPADGFETLEFFDEAALQSGDHGLLSWLTGSLLQTAISALHALRFSSHSFSFHLLPSPRPPTVSSGGWKSLEQPNEVDSHCLWEGFGTLALVSKDDPTDRAMVLEVRPPEVVDAGVLREFAKGRREWWALPGEMTGGDAGQANLLQAQVYDNCVQNQVFFFAVTNLKQWVFGTFDADYSVSHVSPVIDRKSCEPSIMMCLVSWLVRSVDERPQAIDASHIQRRPSLSPISPQHAPPYTSPPSHSHSRTPSYPDFSPSQTSFPNYNHSQTTLPFQQVPHQSHGVFPFQQHFNHGLPGYFDTPPPPSMSPPPAFGGYNTWSGPGRRAFSPTPAPAQMPYGGGMGWYSGGYWPGMQ